MAVPTTQALLDAAKTAELAILQRGQSVTVLSRTYTRADLGELRELIRELETKVARETRGGMRMRQGVPL